MAASARPRTPLPAAAPASRPSPCAGARRVPGASGTRHAVAVLLLAVAAALAVALVLANPAAAAPTAVPLPGSTFQGGDGNQANEGSYTDWQALQSLGRVTTADDTTGTDLMFGPNSKVSDPDGWSFRSAAGNITARDNLTAAWSTTEFLPGGAFGYFAARRESGLGTLAIHLEFNQRTETWVNRLGTTVPCRVTGDKMFVWELGTGQDPLTTSAWTWTAATSDASTGCSKTGTWSALPGPASSVAQAQQSTSTITNFLAPGGATFGGDQFFEAALELNSTIANTCARYRQVQARGQDAGSIANAALLDFVTPVPLDLGGCRIAVDKTGPTEARHGDPVTWSYTVTNPDAKPLSSVSVADNSCPAGNFSAPAMTGGDTDPLLETGETWTYECTTTVGTHDDDEPDPADSVATASGSFNGDTVSATDAHVLDLLHRPSVAVDKRLRRGTSGTYVQGPIQVKVGDYVGYQFDVTNMGDTGVTVDFSDPRCDTGTLLGPSGDADGDNRLDVSESWRYTCRRTVRSTDADPLVNTVTIAARDRSGATASATDSATADVLKSAVALDKQIRRAGDASWSQGPVDVRVGDTLEYRFAVTNPGDTALSVSLSDPRCNAGTLSGAAGDANGNIRLDESETWTYTCRRLVQAADADPFTNTATATGTDALGTSVSSSDSATADVLKPAVTLDKKVRRGPLGAFVDGPIEAGAGDEVWLSFTARNTGDAPVTPTLSDPGCDAGTLSTATGDADGDGRLGTAETWTWTCRHVVALADPDPWTTTATLSAAPSVGPPVTASDSATVDRLNAAISADVEVRRTPADPFASGPIVARAGDVLTYRLTAGNPGDAALSVAVEAALCDAGTVTSPAGDTDGDGLLDPGETWTWTCARAVVEGGPDPVVTSMGVRGTDAVGGTASASDSATADVLRPGLSFDATVRRSGALAWSDGPVEAHVGDPVEYRFTAANTGDADLAVALAAAFCDEGTLSGRAGDADADGRFDPGETWTWTCVRVVRAGDPDPVAHVASATGTDVLGTAVRGEDTATVDVLKPQLRLDKRVRRTAAGAWEEGPIQAHVGDDVELRFEATNPGDAPLSVELADPGCGTAVTAWSGDADGDELLDPSETWVATCSRTLTAGDADPWSSTATLTGTDALGARVAATDSAEVDVLKPALDLDVQIRRGADGTWSAGPIELALGDQAHYRITLANSGDVALAPDLTAPGCDAGTLSGPAGDADGDGRLDPGEIWTWTCRRGVDAGTPDPLVHRVTAQGVDALGGTVTREDTVSADILHPAVALSAEVRTGRSETWSEGSIVARYDDTLFYRYRATNPGDAPLAVTLEESRCDAGTISGPTGDSDGDGRLDPGETWSWTCSKGLSEYDDDPFVSSVRVSGTDPVGTTVSAGAQTEVDVLRPKIAVDAELRRGTGGAWAQGPIKVSPGDELGYRLTVRNVSDTPLTVGVDAPTCDFGTLSPAAGDGNGDGQLDPTETWIYECRRALQPTDPATLTASFTATGTDALGGSDSRTDAAVAEILRSDFAVDLQARAGASQPWGDGPLDVHDGDRVDLRSVVLNTGDAPLRLDVVQPACDAGTVAGPQGDADADGLLDVTETWTWTCRRSVDAATPHPLALELDATGTDAAGAVLARRDALRLDVLRPRVAIDSEVRNGPVGAFDQGPALGYVGDELHYRSTVTNPGNTDLAVSFAGPDCDAGTASGPTGDADADGRLDPGESWVYECRHVLRSDDDDPLRSAFQVTGTDRGGVSVRGTDTVETDVIGPVIQLDKEVRRSDSDPWSQGPEPAHMGDTVRYRYRVSNTGDTPLDAIALEDAACDPDTLAGPGGDEGADAVLGLTEVWTYTCLRTLRPGDFDPFATVARATGRDPLDGRVDDDSDSAEIDILNPAVHVDLQLRRAGAASWSDGPADVRQDDTVEYRATVENPGDAALDLTVEAAACDAGTLIGPTGDANGDGRLDPGETWTYTCRRAVRADDADPHTAAFRVSGTDVIEGTASDSDTALATRLDPRVTVDAQVRRGTSGPYSDGPVIAHVGDRMGYRFTAANPGDAPLAAVLSAPACAAGSLSGPTGDDDADGRLDPGEAWTWTCERTLAAADGDPVRLRATVEGTDSLGQVVSAGDDADVDVLRPQIAVEKRLRRAPDASWSSGPIDARVGDVLAYRFDVTNPGDAPLDAAVSDPGCDAGTLAGPTGDADANGRLDPSETWTWTCHQAVEAGDPDPLETTATAAGADALGARVEATSAARADLLHPALSARLEVRRGAGGAWTDGTIEARAGDELQYRWTVGNPGDASLALAVAPPDCDPLTTSGPSGDADGDGRLDPGESWSWTCRRVVRAEDGDPLQASVSATGTDALGGEVRAQDGAAADLLHAALALGAELRRAGDTAWSTEDVPVHRGDGLEARFTASNPGDVALTVDLAPAACDAGTLSAPQGDADADGRLDPDEVWTWTCRRTVAADDPDPLSVGARATGTDSLGTAVTAEAAARADVLAPRVALVQEVRRGPDAAWSTGPIDGRAGDTVQYRMTLANRGDARVEAALDAPRCDPGTLSPPAGDADGDGRLAVAETWTWTCERVLRAEDPDPLRHDATVTARDVLGGQATAASATEIDLLHPGLSVSLRGRRAGDDPWASAVAARRGDSLELRVTAANTGDAPLHAALDDPGCEPGSRSEPAGDADGDGRLDPDETWAWTCQRVLRAEDPDPLELTARVTGTDAAGGAATDAAGLTVDALHPAILVDAELRNGADGAFAQGPILAHAQDELHYRFTVTNPGDAPLAVTPSAAACDAGTFSGANGDADADGALDPGETWTWTCRRVLGGDDPDPYVARVEVTGTDATGAAVRADDTAETDVIGPVIHIDKLIRRAGTAEFGDGPVPVHVGERLEYRFDVSNTGDTPMGVELADPACDEPPGTPAGDDNANTWLDVDEVFSYTCFRVVRPEDADPYRTEATAFGTDALGGVRTDRDAESAAADILHPGVHSRLEIRRDGGAWSDGPVEARPGSELEYRATVTNSGDTPLASALDLVPCDPGTRSGPAGDADGDGLLDESESHVWTCRYVLQADDPDPLDAVARATGVDGIGGEVVDEARGRAFVPSPEVAVVEELRRNGAGEWTAETLRARAGDLIDHRFRVRNTGDVRVAVDVVNSACAPGTMSGPEGDADGDRRLGLDEEWTFTCRRELKADDPDPHATTVAVEAVDSLGTTARASARAEVDVIGPVMRVKAEQRRRDADAWEAGEIVARAGDTLRYRFELRNTGDAPMRVSLADEGCDPGTRSAPTGDDDGDGELEPAETWTVECRRAVPRDGAAALEARLRATGTDVVGDSDTDQNGVTARTIAPAVAVTRLLRREGDAAFGPGPIRARVGEAVEFRSVVENPGDTPLSVDLLDPGCDADTLLGPAGDGDGDGELDPGERWSYECRHVVSENDGGTYAPRVRARGFDLLGEAVEDEAVASVEVEAPTADLAASLRATGPVVPGRTVTYTLVAANAGPSPARGAQVALELPAGMTVESAVSEGGACADGRCALGTIAAGASAQATMVARAGEDLAGSEVTARARVSATDADPRPDNDEAALTLAVERPAPDEPRPEEPAPDDPWTEEPAAQPADLVVDKTVQGGTRRVGDPLTYLITVVNDGPGRATGVLLTNTLSSAVRLGAIRPSQGTCQPGAAVECALGDIAAGAKATVLVEVRPRRTGRLVTSASVSAAEEDPALANNRSTASTTIRAAATRAKLSLRSSAGRLRPGSPFTARLLYRNLGPGTLRSVAVCLRLPPGARVAAARGARRSGGTVCWRRPILRAGRALRLSARLVLDRRAPGGSLRTVAVARARGTAPAGAAVEARVLPGRRGPAVRAAR